MKKLFIIVFILVSLGLYSQSINDFRTSNWGAKINDVTKAESNISLSKNVNLLVGNDFLLGKKAKLSFYFDEQGLYKGEYYISDIDESPGEKYGEKLIAALSNKYGKPSIQDLSQVYPQTEIKEFKYYWKTERTKILYTSYWLQEPNNPYAKKLTFSISISYEKQIIDSQEATTNKL